MCVFKQNKKGIKINMRIEKIYFRTIDGLELTGLLHTSEDKEEKDVIISVHGMGSNCLKKRDDVIARKVTANNISYFTFNNRGQGLMNSVRTNKGKINQGTIFEDVTDCYYDITAAIKTLTEMGYKKIHLMGHSLGSTKVIYTYNKILSNRDDKILQNIKSIILLSLVDLSNVMDMLNKCNPNLDIVSLATQKEQKGEQNYIIETGAAFMPYVSVKTFLKYYKYNKEIDFAKYTTKDFEFKEINNIKVPLFMRWGNNKELISIPAEEVVKVCNEKIQNDKKDIGFINGATHNYSGVEEILADEIYSFVLQTL